MHFEEIETKYKAKDISLEAFKSFCGDTMKGRMYEVSSYDHYFTRTRNKFIRYRQGPDPQLTMKEKTKISDNYRRVECNLDISSKAKAGTIKKFCEMLGFRLNFSIYKVSTIYWFDRFNTVYYVVYEDASCQKELGRFVEIEMDEHHDWESASEAWDLLLAVEKKLAIIGISSRRRVKNSLFEMFRRWPLAKKDALQFAVETE